MSRKKGSNSRLTLFDLGNTKCPICLTPFTREAVEAGMDVSMEHVPPKTIGGSVKCLTCTDCNRSAGRSLDQVAAMRNKVIRDRKIGRRTKVELDVCGTKHTTYFSPEGIKINDLDTRLASKPNVRRFLDEMKLRGQKPVLLAEITRGPVWDVSKGITISTKVPPAHQVAVSWLRSAYLLVFSLLGQAGYRYADSEAIRPIREQIRNPDKELAPSLLCDVPRLKLPNELIIVNKSQKPFCWIVKIGSLGVLLPHGGDKEHYNEVQGMPDHIDIKPKELIGWKPSKFGANFSFDLSLREDSDHVGEDLFGREIKVTSGHFERKIMVVNQQGLLGTFFPSSPVRRLHDC